MRDVPGRSNINSEQDSQARNNTSGSRRTAWRQATKFGIWNEEILFSCSSFNA